MKIKTADDRVRELMVMPNNLLPKEALNICKKVFRKIGGCGESYVLSFYIYSQLCENLKCKDKSYKISSEMLKSFDIKRKTKLNEN